MPRKHRCPEWGGGEGEKNNGYDISFPLGEVKNTKHRNTCVIHKNQLLSKMRTLYLSTKHVVGMVNVIGVWRRRRPRDTGKFFI